jgi:hypothetical protein
VGLSLEIVGPTMSLTSFELWTKLGRLKLGTRDFLKKKFPIL